MKKLKTYSLFLLFSIVFFSCNIYKKKYYDNETLVSKNKRIRHSTYYKHYVKEYYPNGKIKVKKKYTNGRGFGAFLQKAKVLEYNKKGNLIKKGVFKTGEEIGGFDKNFIITYAKGEKSDTLFLKTMNDFNEQFKFWILVTSHSKNVIENDSIQ